MARVLMPVLAVVLLLVGATLVVGGATLAGAGGSFYYILAGVAVLVSAVGLLRRARYAAASFGWLLAATIPWSLWEAGLDGWALMSRLLGPAIVGLLFLLPSLRKRPGAPRRRPAR